MQLGSEVKRLSPLHNQHQTLKARLHIRDGWLVPEVYTSTPEETAALQDSVGLGDISNRGKLILKGAKAEGIIGADFGESPTKVGDVGITQSNQFMIAKLTTDEFLILVSPGIEKEIAASLKSEISTQNIFVSVIDQTAGLVGLLISGPNSIRVMRKLCALDFSPAGFPNLHVSQSSFAKVRTTIIRWDLNDLPSFELYADRSYADYLWDTILDAGKEFGIQPVGWESTKIPRGQI